MDHNFYLAMSYGATVIALAAELIALRIRRARAIRGINQERDLEAQD